MLTDNTLRMWATLCKIVGEESIGSFPTMVDVCGRVFFLSESGGAGNGFLYRHREIWTADWQISLMTDNTGRGHELTLKGGLPTTFLNDCVLVRLAEPVDNDDE